jgi:hypothetical protein
MRSGDMTEVKSRPAYSGTLFKFVGLSGHRLSRLEGMLLRGEFYFAHPYELNDPFEFRPRFVPMRGHPEIVRLKLKKFLRRYGVVQHGRPKLTPKLAAIRMRELWRADDGGRKNVQMFCMSTSREHPLLWAHYAEGHRGACVQLDPRKAPFMFADDVQYAQEPPEIILPSEADPRVVLRDLVFTKGLDWEYEHEARVLRYALSPNSDLGVHWNGQLAIASHEAVCGITLGASISPENQEAVLNMARRRATPLPVWKSRPHEEQFAFEFDRLL